MRSYREHELKGRRVQIRRHGPCGVTENILVNLKEGESRSLAVEIWLINSRQMEENFISVTY
jgi:hypothetical protein